MIPFYFTLGFSKALKSFHILFNFNSSSGREDRPFSYVSVILWKVCVNDFMQKDGKFIPHAMTIEPNPIQPKPTRIER